MVAPRSHEDEKKLFFLSVLFLIIMQNALTNIYCKVEIALV